MWKRAKLRALIITAALVAVMTYPTWRNLLEYDERPTFELGEWLSVYVPDEETVEGDLTLQLVALPSEFYGDSTPDLRAAFSVDVRPVGNGPRAVAFYLSVPERFTSWLDSCDVDHRHLEASELPEDAFFRSEIGKTYVYVPEGSISCFANDPPLWYRSGNGYAFKTPELAFWAHHWSERSINNNQSNLCTSAELSYYPGITLDYYTPLGAVKDDIVFRVDDSKQVSKEGIHWTDCTSHYGSFLNHSSSVSARVSDAAYTDRSERNLFFAGAAAGVMGGLCVEIISTIFETVEKNAGRPRIRSSHKWRRRLAAFAALVMVASVATASDESVIRGPYSPPTPVGSVPPTPSPAIL